MQILRVKPYRTNIIKIFVEAKATASKRDAFLTLRLPPRHYGASGNFSVGGTSDCVLSAIGRRMQFRYAKGRIWRKLKFIDHFRDVTKMVIFLFHGNLAVCYVSLLIIEMYSKISLRFPLFSTYTKPIFVIY